jgi:hypothetical protein
MLKVYCALVSVACFLRARSVFHKNCAGKTEIQFKEHLPEMLFFTLFGYFALFLSLY